MVGREGQLSARTGKLSASKARRKTILCKLHSLEDGFNLFLVPLPPREECQLLHAKEIRLHTEGHTYIWWVGNKYIKLQWRR